MDLGYGASAFAPLTGDKQVFKLYLHDRHLTRPRPSFASVATAQNLPRSQAGSHSLETLCEHYLRVIRSRRDRHD
jgi:hypothetical protein